MINSLDGNDLDILIEKLEEIEISIIIEQEQVDMLKKALEKVL